MIGQRMDLTHLLSSKNIRSDQHLPYSFENAPQTAQSQATAVGPSSLCCPHHPEHIWSPLGGCGGHLPQNEDTA